MPGPRTTRVWLRLTRGQMIQLRSIARWIKERRPALGRPSAPEVLAHCLDFTYTVHKSTEGKNNAQ